MQGVDTRGAGHFAGYLRILPTTRISDRKQLGEVKDLELLLCELRF